MEAAQSKVNEGQQKPENNYKVDFRIIKQKVNLKNVLLHYGVFQTLKGTGVAYEYRGACPFCNQAKCFTVNTTKGKEYNGVWKCHNKPCGIGGDLFNFVQAKEQTATLQAAGEVIMKNLFPGLFEAGEQDSASRSTKEREPLEPVNPASVVRINEVGLQLGKIELLANHMLEEVRIVRKLLNIDA